MRKMFEDLNTYAKRQSKDVEIFGRKAILGINYVNGFVVVKIKKCPHFLKILYKKKESLGTVV